MPTKFLSRKRGTPRQIGKVFPVLQKKKLPPKLRMKYRPKKPKIEETEPTYGPGELRGPFDFPPWTKQHRYQPLIHSLEDARVHKMFKRIQEAKRFAGDVEPSWIFRMSERLKNSPMTVAQMQKEIDSYYSSRCGGKCRWNVKVGQFVKVRWYDDPYWYYGTVKRKGGRLVLDSVELKRKGLEGELITAHEVEPAVTEKTERASEYFARKYPMMFGGKVKRITKQEVIADKIRLIKQMKKDQAKQLKMTGGEDEIYNAIEDQVSMLKEDIKNIKKQPMTQFKRTWRRTGGKSQFRIGTRTGTSEDLQKDLIMSRVKGPTSSEQVHRELERMFPGRVSHAEVLKTLKKLESEGKVILK